MDRTSPDFCRDELNDPFLKLASLQELRESLQGLSTACTDISSDKVINKTLNIDNWDTICPVVVG